MNRFALGFAVCLLTAVSVAQAGPGDTFTYQAQDGIMTPSNVTTVTITVLM